MDIYSKEELEKQKKKRKNAKIAMIAVSAAAVVMCIVMACTVKPLNETSHKFWASAALSLAACFDVYVSSFVLPYLDPESSSKRSKFRRVLRNIFRQLLLYLSCIILSTVAVTFVFNCITDTVPAKKVTIFADVPSMNSQELEEELNKDLPEGIKMVKAHPFSYTMFGLASDDSSDIYIVEKSSIEKYIEHFAPVSEFLEPRDVFKYYEHDGTAYGIQVYGDAARCAAGYMDYEEGGEYYLFFGRLSVHPGRDGAAAYIAERLLMLK